MNLQRNLALPALLFLIASYPAPAQSRQKRIDNNLYESIRLKKPLEEIQKYLSEGGNPNSLEFTSSPLTLAAQMRCIDILALLLDHGCDINAPDSSGNTALLSSLNDNWYAPSEEVTQFLIDAGSDVNFRKNNGPSALLKAINHPSIVKILIDARADINIQDAWGETPLSLAICVTKDNSDFIQYLLDNGADTSIITGNEKIARYCLYHSTSILQQLIDFGAPITATDDSDNNLLHKLVQVNKDTSSLFAEILIKNGVALDHKNNYGEIPLFTACSRGRDATNLVEYYLNAMISNHLVTTLDEALLADCYIEYCKRVDNPAQDSIPALFFTAGLSPNARTSSQDPLVTKFYNESEHIDFLISKGASVDAVNSKGESLLYQSIDRRDWQTVTRILKEDCNVNHKTPNGTTAFMITGDLDTCRLLLEKGADPLLRDNDGNTAMHYFARHGFFRSVDQIHSKLNFLIQVGLNPADTNGQGNSAMAEAVKSGNSPVIITFYNTGYKDYNGTYDDGNNALLQFLLHSNHEPAQNRLTVTKILLETGVTTWEANEEGDSAYSLSLTDTRFTQDLAALIREATPQDKKRAIEQEQKRIQKEQFARDFPDKMADTVKIMAFPLILGGLSIAMREGVYQDNNAQNWMNVPNAMLGTALMCGAAIALPALIALDNSSNKLGTGIIGILGVGLGVIVGSIVGLHPTIRNAYASYPALYYLPAVTVHAIGLYAVTQVWN